MSTSPGILAPLNLPPSNPVLLLILTLGLLVAWLWREALGRAAWRRIAFGLGAMIVVRLALGAFALWTSADSAADPLAILGHADRSVGLLCTIGLVWILAGGRSRLASLAAVAFGVVVLVLAIALGTLLYSTLAQVPGLHYNTTLLAPLWDGLVLLVALIGAAIVLVGKPPGRWIGLLALGALIVGASLQILISAPSEDFAALLRGGEVIAFALAVVWVAVVANQPSRPQAQPVAVVTSAVAEAPAVPAPPPAEPKGPETARSMAEDMAFWAARTMNADVALILARAEDGSGLYITAGYDQVRAQPLLGAFLPGEQSGRIIAQLAQEGAHAYRAKDLPADYRRIAEAVGLEQPGPALLMPLAAGSNASTALLVLSPYSGREWSNEDKLTLGAFAAPLADDLTPSQLIPESVPEAQRPRGLMSDAEMANLREENTDLSFRLRQAQEELQTERQRADALEVQLAQRPAADGLKDDESEVARLEEALVQVLLNRDEVIASLRSSLEGQPASIATGERLDEFMAEQSEEVQQLRSALDRAEKELERQGVGWDKPAGPPASLRSGPLGEQVVLSLARELLKTVLSVRSDSELLAGQGAALLGSMQRQPLDHLRDKAYHAEALAQDLENLAAFARAEAPVDWGPLEVGDEVDAALTASSELIRERGLSVHLELPDTTFDAEADRACVRQLLYHLIRNAVLATPPQSEVGVRAHLRMPEGGPPSALLVSVDDGGAGIAPDDYPMVFDAIARGTGSPLAGLGEKGIGMAVAHELAESVGGRIWVESQAGQGSTFSIEVPLAAPQSGVFG
jgi:signal transduction histidine kinase